MTPDLKAHVLDRLVETGVDNEEWSFLVVAALDGPDALDNYLAGRSTGKTDREARGPASPKPPGSQGAKAEAEPPGVYVSSITVEGFRGIGQGATLTLRPGPGLTLVVGRNGSGKSSFAEGLEVLLTGQNYRWLKRTRVWVDGWRNLHHGTASLKADLIVEGQGPLTLTRTWDGDEVTSSAATVAAKGRPASALDSLGWSSALATFRPFLSYNELGSLLEDGPSKLYDALSSVLGLDEMTNLQAVIADARKVRADQHKAATEQAKQLAQAIGAVDVASGDSRPSAALRALAGKTWDLATLTDLATGEQKDGASGIDILRRLQSLARPDVAAASAIVLRLRAAEQACATFAGTNAERSNETARLLREALAFHEKHAPDACPVCGTAGALGAGWRVDTAAEVERLTKEATACLAAESERRSVIAQARSLVMPVPPALAQAADIVSLDSLSLVRTLWSDWAIAQTITSAPALAAHIESRVLELAEAVGVLADEAGVELTRREDLWRPLQLRIAAWLPSAREAQAASAQLPQFKKAEEWLKEAANAIRNARFRPIAARVAAVWKQLRLQSNVDLGDVELAGTGQRRHVTLPVNVDGIDADALGVMSQGELHSLALSLFLPRATLPESPFRFVSVDDPVQSMDPSRVEGLARALADAARTRQVIVFTHDDRLPESVRRLGIPATVIGVSRRAGSLVETRPELDPVSAYLDDARAVLLTKDLPHEVVVRVVPGFCRSALEAACMSVVRRVRLKKGHRHTDIEDLLIANGKLYPLMSLALFDDETKTNDVLNRLNNIVGGKGTQRGAAAFKACNAGAHEALDEDPKDLVDTVKKLTTYLMGMPA